MSLQQLTSQTVKPYLDIEFENGQCDGNFNITGNLTVEGTTTLTTLTNNLIASYIYFGAGLTANQYVNLYGNAGTTVTSTATPYNSLYSNGVPIGKVTYLATGAGIATQFTIRNGSTIVASITFLSGGGGSGSITFDPPIVVPLGNQLAIAYASGPSPTAVQINLYAN